jgi:hypothetical protein
MNDFQKRHAAEIELLKVESKLKGKYGTWRTYENVMRFTRGNAKRRIKSYVQKLNHWLEPLGLKVEITEINL